MLEFTNVVPITVSAAVTIFIVKEILEFFRRRGTDRRKISALHQLLALECERNNWTTKWFIKSLQEIRSSVELGYVVRIDNTVTGKQRLTFVKNDGEGGSPIPIVNVMVAEKYFYESATLDAKLFNLLESTISSLAELQHLRDGLVEHVSKEQEWLEAWSQYADRELAGIEKDISCLYRHCTGKTLEKQRLR